MNPSPSIYSVFPGALVTQRGNHNNANVSLGSRMHYVHFISFWLHHRHRKIRTQNTIVRSRFIILLFSWHKWNHKSIKIFKQKNLQLVAINASKTPGRWNIFEHFNKVSILFSVENQIALKSSGYCTQSFIFVCIFSAKCSFRKCFLGLALQEESKSKFQIKK